MRAMARRFARLVSLAVVGAFSLGASPPVEVDVVVNDASPAKQLTKQSAQDVFFLRRQYWSNHSAIVIVMHTADAALQETFCAKVLERECEVMERMWLEKRYQGALFAKVMRVGSVAELQRVLTQNPDAIGYVRRGTAPAGTRVVLRP